MAVTCARCGTQNPDGNQFCQACGTPLTAAAIQPAAPPSFLPGPPAAPPPAPPGPPAFPPPPPPGYQSPYYAPSGVGPQPPVHRTPWTLIIAAVVVLVLLMAGCGTAIALLGNRNSPGNGSNPVVGILPSPSPAGTPSPVGSPPSTTSGGSVSNSGVAFILPAGWSVVNKDDQSITISDDNSTGSITIGSGASSPAQNVQQNKDTVDKFFQGKYPDTKTCAGSKTVNTTLNGATGIAWELCFTLTSGGQSVPAAAPLFAGANADGSVYYVVLILATQTDVNGFVKAATPILDSIQWKLQ
jgi:hypothetical protein